MRCYWAWVQAIVSLDETEEEEKFVNIEAYALSDQIVKLCKEGWFAEEQETTDVEKMGRLHTNKDVIVAGKDTQEVDTDFLIIAVPILDHQVLCGEGGAVCLAWVGNYTALASKPPCFRYP